MRYPFVLLDVGETLVGPRRSYGAVYAEVLASMGLELGAPRLERAIRTVADQLRRQIPPGVDRFSHFPGAEAGFWLRFARRSISQAAGREVDEPFARRALERLREAFREPDAWRVYDDVVPTLETLVGLGCRLAVVSNWDSQLPALLGRLGLAEYFETLGVSHLEGVEKPDPRLFQAVLERLGAPTDRALHVGNVPELDLEGARAAGLAARLVDRRGELQVEAWPDLLPLPGVVAD